MMGRKESNQTYKQTSTTTTTTTTTSDFIWPFLRPYMGVIPNPKMVIIFPISCILAHIFSVVIEYFLKREGKFSFQKSEIKSLTTTTTTTTTATAITGNVQ